MPVYTLPWRVRQVQVVREVVVEKVVTKEVRVEVVVEMDKVSAAPLHHLLLEPLARHPPRTSSPSTRHISLSLTFLAPILLFMVGRAPARRRRRRAGGGGRE